jgi:diadenylate cyclase
MTLSVLYNIQPLIFQFLKPSTKDVIDVLIMWFILYQLIKFVNRVGGHQILIGLSLIILFLFAATLLKLEMILSIVGTLRDYWLLIVLILFQQEIRSILVNISNTSFLDLFKQTPQKSIYAPILSAVSTMSFIGKGAIIVIERRTKLDEYIATGERIDSLLSSRLLSSIFEKGSVLHDGAVIVRKDRIVAAKVVLPLSKNIEYRRLYGTRHLAAVGVSELTDALAIVVSEERSSISVAQGGQLEADVNIERLTHIIGEKTR